MKIACLTISYPNLSEQFICREFDGLAARGHDVRVFTARPPAGPLPVATGLTVTDWNDAELRWFAPDVLYGSLGIPAQRRTVEAARALGLPYVLRAWQGYDMFCNPSPQFYGEVIRDPLCRAVVVEDEFARQYAAVEMALTGDKVRIVPNCIYTDVFTPARQRHSDPVRVLAIARLVQKKGLRFLCAAWRSLCPAIKEVAELVIIGYGPEEEQLRAEAGLNNRVTFRPPIPPSQLADEYRAADLFVAPCVTTRAGDADGVPTTVLEAMACGLPVLASDLHSMPLYLQAENLDEAFPYPQYLIGGDLVPPANIAALAERLQKLICDEELRHVIGQNARRIAEQRFSLAKSTTALESILGAA